MANREHVKRLKAGVVAWNKWRKRTNVIPDLSGANFRNADLDGVDLSEANLEKINLAHAKLNSANLSGADLDSALLIGTEFQAANFVGAALTTAALDWAVMRSADLSGADLSFAMLIGTDLDGATVTGTRLTETAFSNVDLSKTIGLDLCKHDGPSIIDHRTLRLSGTLPLSFLRGAGLPDALIEYLPSLLAQAIQHFSCFISYSSKDQDFADRLYADLQNKGVRCWFAPDDMPIGGKILDEIDTAIRLRDKLLLILSEHSIKSDWVEDEVTKAFEEERKRGQAVLFPVRLDDAVMDTDEAWAAKLRARHIGDFRQWKSHDAYKNSFARVLRDLTVKKT